MERYSGVEFSLRRLLLALLERVTANHQVPVSVEPQNPQVAFTQLIDFGLIAYVMKLFSGESLATH